MTDPVTQDHQTTKSKIRETIHVLAASAFLVIVTSGATILLS